MTVSMVPSRLDSQFRYPPHREAFRPELIEARILEKYGGISNLDFWRFMGMAVETLVMAQLQHSDTDQTSHMFDEVEYRGRTDATSGYYQSDSMASVWTTDPDIFYLYLLQLNSSTPDLIEENYIHEMDHVNRVVALGRSFILYAFRGFEQPLRYGVTYAQAGMTKLERATVFATPSCPSDIDRQAIRNLDFTSAWQVRAQADPNFSPMSVFKAD